MSNTRTRATAKIARLRSGDRFVCPKTHDTVKVVGWVRFIDPERTKVQVPVQVDGGQRPSRRIYPADKRIALCN
jgi:hypothetical protein